MSQYYHNHVTARSFKILQELQRTYDFILIGDWAVFVWTKGLKSKDIDIVLDYPELAKFKNQYALLKNDRLKKYEAKDGEVDIDIYVPNYSQPGLPAAAIAKYTVKRGGFRVPRPEILLMLKQAAHQERQGTPKGEKDMIDIISLLSLDEIDLVFYKKLLTRYGQEDLKEKLKVLLTSRREVPECGLNQHTFSRLKARLLAQLAA